MQRGIDPTLDIERPQNFSRMLETAETLGREFDMMRVDFYDDRGQPGVGGHGLSAQRPAAVRAASVDDELGARWDIAASAYPISPPRRFARVYRAMLVAAGYVEN